MTCSIVFWDIINSVIDLTDILQIDFLGALDSPMPLLRTTMVALTREILLVLTVVLQVAVALLIAMTSMDSVAVENDAFLAMFLLFCPVQMTTICPDVV